jgi:holo-[acyl-carrier protein] synthase
MTIVGIGIDAIEIDRIADTFKRYDSRFLDRIYTTGEIEYCTRQHDPAPSLAGRFAVKEATMKALGTGATQGVRWRDIEVVRRRGGAPILVLHGVAAGIAERLGSSSSLVTITHSRTLAIAQVLLLGE